jgi:hypothetical protein
VTERFVVMTPKGTRLLGVVGLALGVGVSAWAWTWESGALPLWWKLLMTVLALPFVAVGLQYVLSGRYPVIVLDDEGITYRPFDDPITLLRRGPVVRLRWPEISSIGYEHGRAGLRWLTIRSNRSRRRPRWVRALGAGERAPYIRISLSVVRVSERELVDELRSRALPHTFLDERDGRPSSSG